jgi:hypothetical protein
MTRTRALRWVTGIAGVALATLTGFAVLPRVAHAAGCVGTGGENINVGEVQLNDAVISNSGTTTGVTYRLEGGQNGFFPHGGSLGYLHNGAGHHRSLTVRIRDSRTDRCLKTTVVYETQWANSPSDACGTRAGRDQRVWTIDTCVSGNAATLLGTGELKMTGFGPSTFTDWIVVTDPNGAFGSPATSQRTCNRVWGAGCVNCC